MLSSHSQKEYQKLLVLATLKQVIFGKYCLMNDNWKQNTKDCSSIDNSGASWIDGLGGTIAISMQMILEDSLSKLGLNRQIRLEVQNENNIPIIRFPNSKKENNRKNQKCLQSQKGTIFKTAPISFYSILDDYFH